MTVVIIRPAKGQTPAQLIRDVTDVLGGRVTFGSGGVVLDAVQAHTYLAALLDTPDTIDAAPAAQTATRPAKKAARKTVAARPRTARGTGE